MADTIKIEDIEERVVLVGVSEQDGDDADDSLSELAELVKTAGATVVGTLIQRREKIHPGTYVGTGKVADDKIEQAVEKVFDLTPAAIIRDLDLRKPIYRKLAAYGHMGREDLGVKWENTDRVEALKAAVAEL